GRPPPAGPGAVNGGTEHHCSSGGRKSIHGVYRGAQNRAPPSVALEAGLCPSRASSTFARLGVSMGGPTSLSDLGPARNLPTPDGCGKAAVCGSQWRGDEDVENWWLRSATV